MKESSTVGNTLSVPCIHKLFEAQVKKDPQAIAVKYKNTVLTYGELNSKANQLAYYLVSTGIKPDDLVGLFLNRGLEMTIGLLAILKSGGAYVPLTPEDPPMRLASVIDDSKMRIVVSSAEFRTSLTHKDVSIICVNEFEQSQSIGNKNYPTTNLPEDIVTTNSDHLAYVIYTSGSTGKPKGVMVPHAGVVNYLRYCVTEFFQECTGSVVSNSLSFDATVTSLLTPWICGKRVHMLPQDKKEIENLSNILVNTSEDLCFKFTPAHLSALDLILDNSFSSDRKHQFVVGGEQMSMSIALRWKKHRYPKAVLTNHYGPTEAIVGCSTFVINDYREIDQQKSAVNIGRPISNVSFYVLDTQQNPVSTGESGELHVAGPGLARGYLNQPELTEKYFTYNQLPGLSKSRMYKTGDLVRQLPDGNFEFLGRIDDQVKIHGFRIELGEIEALLNNHSLIRESLVIATDEPKKLVAYLIMEETDGWFETLSNYLRSHLAHYMIPAAYIPLERFPLKFNGKIDRKALPEPIFRDHQSGIYSPPENEIEKILCEVCQKVLGQNQVGVNDNFFSLGGDSILMLQAVYHANQQGVSLTIQEFFQHQTIRKVAQYIGDQSKKEELKQVVTGRQELLPIQLEFLRRDQIDQHHYNQSVIVKTPKGFNLSHLKSIVKMWYKVHDVLRLSFQKTDNNWLATYQNFHPLMVENSIAYKRFNNTYEANDGEGNGKIIGEMFNEIQSSLSLQKGPLLKVVFFETDEKLGSLLLVAHHLIIDGVSWRILLDQLERAYIELEESRGLTLPAKYATYQQWGSYLQCYKGEALLLKEESYWVGQLQEVLDPLPVDSACELTPSNASTEQVEFTLSMSDTQALLKRCHYAYHTQMNDLLLAAVLLGTYKWAGSHVLRIKLEGHGREDLGQIFSVGDVVGWFTDVFPHVLQTSDPESIAQTIMELKEQIRNIPNKGIGFGVIHQLKENQQLIHLWNNAEIPLSFNYLGQFDQTLNSETRFQLTNNFSGKNTSDRLTRNQQLGINVMVVNNQLSLTLDYSDLQYSITTINTYANFIKAALEEIIHHCLSKKHSRFTPSDFRLVKVNQSELDQWQTEFPHLENIYPSTTMQKGLLFYSHLDQSAYVNQIYMDLNGDLNIECFKNAWHRVVLRHPVFRTVFVGEQLHQLVLTTADPNWTIEDWSHLGNAEQCTQFEKFRRQDKIEGFQFSKTTLMRLSLIRLGENKLRFLWSIHHALMDGWCLPIVFKEVITFYNDLRANRASELRPVYDYEAYIEWLCQKNQKTANDYWTKALSGIKAPTLLGTDTHFANSSSTRTSDTNAELPNTCLSTMHLSDDLYRSLINFAKCHRITINILVQGAWSYLLHQLTRQKEVIYGETVSGRPAELPGVQEMVGLFINTLPVVVQFDEQNSIVGWLQGMLQNSVERSEYSYLALAAIQKLSRLPNSSTLFDSLVVFENYPWKEAVEAQSEITSAFEIDNIQADEQTNYKLTLTVVPREQLELKLTFRHEDFSEPTIDSVLNYLQEVLVSIANYEATKISELPRINKSISLSAVGASQSQLSTASAVEKSANPSAKNTVNNRFQSAKKRKNYCVHELFESIAANQPAAVAIQYEDKQLSYDELNRMANQIAHQLIAEGVRAEHLVGIYFKRSFEMVVAVLAVLKAGGAYVPLDPDDPPLRLESIIQDSNIAVLITAGHYKNAFSDKVSKIICLDTLVQDPVQQSFPTDNIETGTLGLSSENLVYVIYTSGSTGKPKGVMISHRGVVHYLKHCQATYYNDVKGSILSSSLSFDATVTSLWGPLVSGHTVCIVPQDKNEIQNLSDFLFQEEENYLFKLTPSHLVAIDKSTDSSISATAEHKIVVGGEQLHNDITLRWKRDRLPYSILYNEYGPTETVVGCSVFAIEDEEDIDLQNNAISIGKPISKVRLFVFGPDQKPVAAGDTGELFIAGPGLARGYLNRLDLTKKAFVDHQFSRDSSIRLYKTGDLVRYLADGNLEFVGRVDHQVKIRGYRIELGEIESAINRHELVQECVVVVKNNPKLLVAYLSIKNLKSALNWEKDIRQHLVQYLPDYMLPNVYVLMDEFPLTINGKIDRKDLPEPKKEDFRNTDTVQPATKVERTMCEICQVVLGLEQVGVADNFFSIGGDSILMMQVVYRINQAGITLSVQEFFQYKTIRNIALHLGEQTKAVEEKHIVKGKQVFLPIQLDFLRRDLVDQHHFNQSVLLTTPSGFKVEHLHALLTAWYKTHDVFRLLVKREEHQLFGEYQPYKPAMVDNSIEYIKTERITDQEIEEIGNDHQSKLNLEIGPLFKAILIDCEEESGRLLLIFHHLIIDGISWRILLPQLEAMYRELIDKNTTTLPVVNSSYQQWGSSLQSYLRSDKLSKEKEYWLEQQQLSIPPLPTDFFIADKQDRSHSEQFVFSLSELETDNLLKKCNKAFFTQINDLLLTALYLAMYEWTGESKFRLDLEGHGREDIIPDIDLSNLVGWFTTIFPVVLESSHPLSIAKTIKAIKEQLRSVPRKGIGFGLFHDMLEDAELVYARKQAGLPFVFNYLGQFDQSWNADSKFQPTKEPTGLTVSNKRQRGHLLALNSIVINRQMTFTLDYNKRQYESNTIEVLAMGIRSALQEVIKHCLSKTHSEYTPSDFPLTQVTFQQLLQWQRQFPKLENVYDSTPMQKGLLYHSQLDRSAYVTQVYLNLEGELDTPVFQKAWLAVIQRHPIFRTLFIGERLSQLVVSEAHPTWIIEDWSDLPEHEQKSAFETFRAKDKLTGFPLEQAPLIRFSLLKLRHNKFCFLWSIHHALMDGWSLQVVFREVISHYFSLSDGSLPDNRSVPVYEDYIAWLQKQDVKKAKAYWCKTLENVESPGILEAEKLSTQNDSSGSDVINLRLDNEFTSKIQEFAQRNQTTVNIIFQAAWSYLLSRYTNSKNVIFGETVSGRPSDLAGVDKMVGLFINTLPVSIEIDSSQYIAEWLTSLHEKSVQRDEYSFLSLAVIQQLSPLPNQTALFDSLLVFENYPLQEGIESESSNHSNLRILDINTNEQTNYRLTLTVSPRPFLDINLSYLKQEFSSQKITALLRFLKEILLKISDPNILKLSELPALPETDRKIQFETWNQTQSTTPVASGIHVMFEEQVKKTPSAIAVLFQDQSLTYQDLNDQANILADYLVQIGFQSGEFAGIYLQRTPLLIIALLAILKSGGAYVALDPKYPLERNKAIAQDAELRCILSERFLLHHQFLNDPGFDVLQLDNLQEKASTANRKKHSFDPSLTAYMLYTSGSSGKPKGVIIRHYSACAMLSWAHGEYGKEELSSVFASTSICFDLSVFEIFVPLTMGGSVVLGENAMELFEVAQSKEITLLNTVPSAFRQLLNQENFPRSIKVVNLAGETLPLELVQKGYQSTSVNRIYNLYGPSEDTTYSTYYPIPRSENQAPSIGKPIDNTQVYLLDVDRKPLPIGVIGEIYLSGLGLAKEYYGQSTLTDERFVKNPFSSNDRDRMYKTGDLARFRTDGNIEFIGRDDQQVKLRGFRIELTEIEYRLSTHPSVHQAVAVVLEKKHSQQLVAYVVKNISDEQTDTEYFELLRIYLSNYLPDYMVPVKYIIVDTIPMHPNGKINRKHLADQQVEFKTSEEKVLPRNSVEVELKQIWEDVLEVDNISMRDNFFELGGHSLLAIAMVSRIKDRLHQVVSITDLFQHATIEKLSLLVQQESTTKRFSHLVMIQPEGKKRPLFCIHPAGGHVYRYVDLASQLGKNQPLIGIKSHGFDDDIPPHTDYHDAARDYIKSIKTFQAKGPYNLIGLSLGGVIVYEMAQQLLEMGEQVRFLGLLDTFEPSRYNGNIRNEHPAVSLASMFAAYISISDEETNAIDQSEWTDYVVNKIINANRLPLGYGKQELLRLAKTRQTITIAMTNYQSKPYSGKINMFCAEEGNILRHKINTLGWEKFAKNITVHSVPGEHDRITQLPAVKVLADEIRACLE